MKTLLSFGWDSQTSSVHPHSEEFIPARVLTQEKDCYRVVTERGELDARIRGRMRHLADSPTELPAVGDWVWVQARFEEAKASIVAVLPRRSALTRKAVDGSEIHGQIIASNVDYVFLVTAMNRELKLRRLERYLGMIGESGARPIIILNKRDLCDDPGAIVAEVLAIAGDAPVHCVSAQRGEGLEELESYFSDNETVALVGSSGVGKSTLTNALLGRDEQFVSHIRAGDDRGRHTTSRRDLILRDQGGCIIDTPGMRELHLWAEDDSEIDNVFEDVRGFASQCRFNDCQHQTEPGCGILEALDSGILDPGRFQNYLKLKREQAWLERKVSVQARQAEKRRRKSFTKEMYKHIRRKNRY